jgi:flagellar basal body-associated protein FliL
MNRRATIVLLLIAVLLATFLVLTQTGTLKLGEEVEKEETPPPIVPVFEAAEGAQVIAFNIIDNETGDQLAASLNAEDATWEVTEAPSEPEEGLVVDTVRLSFAVDSLSTLVSSREIDEMEDLNLEVFGLETARYTLTYYTVGGGEFSLDMGDQTPDGISYYTQRQGDDVVLLVSSGVLDAFVGFLAVPPYAEPTPIPEIVPTP